ncbi:MAG TPA: hypothetical protein VFU72_02625, partial [Nitrolancea sp.]|nr:hypothetical protein [Nitrolancea sp.]
IGLTTKLLFIWFLIAIPAAYAILLAADWLAAPSRRPLRDSWARLRADLPLSSPLDLVAAGGGFLIGAAPVIYYNLVSRGSYLVFRANLTQTDRGVDNFALWHNAKVELDAVRVLLDGGYFWFYGGIYTNRLWPWFAGLAALGLLLLTHAAPELRRYRRATVFLLAFSAVIFLLSCFTVSILGPTHLLILLPIPQLLVAAFALLGGRWLAARLPRPLRLAPPALAALLLVTLAAGDLLVDARYHQALARTGGYTNFSSAIYTLADQLEAEGDTRPYALDWGFKYNLEIISDGRVVPQEIYGATYEPGPDFEAAVRRALADPNAVFIAHVEGSESFPRLDAFRRIVAESGRQLVLVRTDKELSGRPAYYEFRVK